MSGIKLKPGIIQHYLDRCGIGREAFADICDVAHGTIENARQLLPLRVGNIKKIAKGMGLDELEYLLLTVRDKRSVSEVVEYALEKQGISIWEIGLTRSTQSSRFKAIEGSWEGFQDQMIPKAGGSSVMIRSELKGSFKTVGCKVRGEFVAIANSPGNFVDAAAVIVEGYFFGDKHIVAIYRFKNPESHVYGSIRLTLSLCSTCLEGMLHGWGGLTSHAWVETTIKLNRKL